MKSLTTRNLVSHASSSTIGLGARLAYNHGRTRPLVRANIGQQQSILISNNLKDDQAASAASSPNNDKYKWTFDGKSSGSREDGRLVIELPVSSIRRPLGRTRGNDPEKVAALMESIKEIGLQEPIDVLEVDGVYYGFSGCHRFEAHQRLGAETIRCRVRKATKEVLKMHLM
ncbi:hypothetical protein Vafri_21710 [Volvox africanus]|uniref:sulfiredoxin n=1 Tax=Volvox africanus TaxID=51714 RepID=A0A8J4FBU3_9CHLO|nr:hypothetical protein Vafri_21710 [Volvox africanus]